MAESDAALGLPLAPHLLESDFSVTSPRTGRYNCFAWAAGEDRRWWAPGGDPETTYWPSPSRSLRTEDVIESYRAKGFEACGDGVLEDGIEKIAIYEDEEGDCTHMARQCPDGRWTSKMGRLHDIIHPRPEDLEGGLYGKISCFLARPRGP